MTKGEPKTPASTSTIQTDVPTEPQPQAPNVQQEYQSAEQSSTDDGETKLTIEVETGSAQDAGYVHHEVTDNQPESPDEIGDILYSTKVQQKPLTDEERVSNIQTDTGGSQDSGNAASELFSVRCKVTESLSQGESQYENRGAFGSTDQAERPPFEKEYESNTQKETGNVQDTRRGTPGFATVLGSQSHESGKDHFREKKDTFQVERELSHPPITQQPETHVRIDVDKIQNPKEGHYGSPHTVDTGSQRLRPQSVHRESRSSTRPSSIQLERDASRPMNVHILKSEDINPGERHIFETGGEESLNPSLNPQSGAICYGADKIEDPQDETPEDQVSKDELNDDVKPQPTILSTLMARLRTIHPGQLCGNCIKFVGKQFGKAPIFYTCSVFGIALSSSQLHESNYDRDIYICILIFFVIGILISLVERGKCSERFEKIEETSCGGVFNICCVCCACCRSVKVEDQARKSTSGYGSPDQPSEITGVDANVDVSGTGRDYELRPIRKHRSTNSDEIFEFLRGDEIDVDAPQTETIPPRHHSDLETDEDLEFKCEHCSQGLACSCSVPRPKRKPDSDSETSPEQPPVLHHTVVVDIHDPRTSMNPASTSSSGRHCKTQSGLSQSPYKKNPRQPKGILKKRYDQPPKLTQTSYEDVHASETSKHLESTSSGEDHTQNIAYIDATTTEEFRCEHYGKGVSCSCASLFKKKEE